MTKTEIVALQQALGFTGPEVDGIYGPLTQAAHRRYLDALAAPVPTLTPPAAKPWWTSRALWGALATLAASLGGLAGYVLDASQLTELAVTAATLASGLLALVGTLRRAAPIDPGLVARLPGGDLRLPVRPDRPPHPPADPRGVFGDH